MEAEILVKNAVIVDKGGPHNGRKADVLIKKGRIVKIGESIEAPGAKIIERPNLHLSPGWLDVGPQSGEPGLEHRETLESLSEAASAGGYTAVAVFPNTEPVIQRRADIDSILKKSAHLPVRILPVGAATRDCTGNELTEFMDMARSGAVAFSNGRESITDAGLMGRAILYADSVEKPIINRPLNRAVNPFGQMHEGEVSIQLGLEGFPHEAETILLYQDTSMLEYSGGQMVALGITSALSVKMLKTRPKGFFAAVPAMNLLFTDNDLLQFDTAFKVLPPLRSEKDRKALIKGVKSGLINMVFSNHDPMEEEVKNVEFGLSAFGASTIESAFSMAWTALAESVKIEDVIALFSHQPRKAMNLEIPEITEDKIAELTLFDPDAEIHWEEKHLLSKSKASPAIGKTLRGRIYGTVIEGNVNLIE